MLESFFTVEIQSQNKHQPLLLSSVSFYIISFTELNNFNKVSYLSPYQ